MMEDSKSEKINNRGGGIQPGDQGFSLDTLELKDYVQFRYPFLLIDRVTKVIPGKSAKGYKFFSNNDWFFSGHFPDAPMVPGALQFEAIGQMLCVALNTLPGMAGTIPKLLSFDVKCRKPVLPGDRFDIEVKILFWRDGICKGKGVGYVDGETVCEATVLHAVTELME